MPVVIGGDVDTSDMCRVTLDASDLGAACQAIAIRISGELTEDPDANPTWILVKELQAWGHGERTAKCNITSDDPPSTIDEYYAAKLKSKLGNISRVALEDLGETSDLIARARARQLVQAALDQAIMRTITITGELPAALPERGDTVQVMYNIDATTRGTYTGVVYEMTYQCTAGAETLTLSMIDYDSTELQ